MLTDCGCAGVFDGMCGWDASVNGIGEAGAVALAKALESGQCQLTTLKIYCESMRLAARAAGLCCACRSGRHARSVARVRCTRVERRAWVALLDAERLRLSLLFLLCVWAASGGNGIGRATCNRVDRRVRICRRASRDAPLMAARWRLALATGLVSRLCEHSVLADCPLDIISKCGTYCSTQVALRILVAQSTGHQRHTSGGTEHCLIQ